MVHNFHNWYERSPKLHYANSISSNEATSEPKLLIRAVWPAGKRCPKNTVGKCIQYEGLPSAIGEARPSGHLSSLAFRRARLVGPELPTPAPAGTVEDTTGPLESWWLKKDFNGYCSSYHVCNVVKI